MNELTVGKLYQIEFTESVTPNLWLRNTDLYSGIKADRTIKQKEIVMFLGTEGDNYRLILTTLGEIGAISPKASFIPFIE